MQASGRSSLTSPSAAKQGAADEISLEVEGLDGATDLASEAQSPVKGEPMTTTLQQVPVGCASAAWNKL